MYVGEYMHFGEHTLGQINPAAIRSIPLCTNAYYFSLTVVVIWINQSLLRSIPRVLTTPGSQGSTPTLGTKHAVLVNGKTLLVRNYRHGIMHSQSYTEEY